MREEVLLDSPETGCGSSEFPQDEQVKHRHHQVGSPDMHGVEVPWHDIETVSPGSAGDELSVCPCGESVASPTPFRFRCGPVRLLSLLIIFAIGQ